ncbi:MAG: two-component regulator propeller domain-containing protein, partial [Aliiglaciecola sp.]|uniref:ligand-binding sensor domain-containing protein n=1 Tax=Aliiglaciecola sp. TaxID=1872441 RepID=UPI0032996A03
MNRLFQSAWLIAFTLLLSFSHSTSYANVADIQLRNFSVQQGLSQSTVLDIIEDQEGYIWVATVNGLNRFNGVDFKQYTVKLPDGKQFPIEMIRKLFIDSDNNLWFSSIGAIAKYLPEKDSFQVYTQSNSNLKSHNFWAIGETTDGRLLFSGEKQLYEYNQELDDFTAISFSNGEQLNDSVRTIYTQDDIIWLGTERNGIYAVDPKTNKLYNLEQDNPWNIHLEAKNLYDIVKIDDQYWLGTSIGAIVLSEDYQVIMQL